MVLTPCCWRRLTRSPTRFVNAWASPPRQRLSSRFGSGRWRDLLSTARASLGEAGDRKRRRTVWRQRYRAVVRQLPPPAEPHQRGAGGHHFRGGGRGKGALASAA